METTQDEKEKLRFIIEKMIDQDEAWFEENNIRVGSKDNFWVANYGIKGKNEYNRLVRGLIVEKPDGAVEDPLALIRSFPFIRFFNHGEEEADSIDFSNSEMLEKMDGTMVGVFFPTGDLSDPHWHTRKMISSYEQDLDLEVTAFDGTKQKLMEKIGEFVKSLDFQEEDLNRTYVFEFIHKASAVITKYTEDQWGLYLLAGRDVQTHRELFEDDLDVVGTRIKCRRPLRMNAVDDFDKIMETMAELAETCPDFEGFVFRDKITGKRLKLKSQDYVTKHHQLGTLNIKRLIPLVLKGESAEIVSYFPHVRECVEDIKKRHSDYLDKTEALIEEYHAKCSDMTRHETWNLVSKEVEDSFAKSVLMRTLDKDKYVRSTLEEDLQAMAITDYKKGTYKGVQVFQTTSAHYLLLMGFRNVEEEDVN